MALFRARSAVFRRIVPFDRAHFLLCPIGIGCTDRNREDSGRRSRCNDSRKHVHAADCNRNNDSRCNSYGYSDAVANCK
jgi:hypothetical protein